MFVLGASGHIAGLINPPDGHAGAQRAAPRRAGSKDFPVIEPAPGRYVKAQA